MITRVDDIPKDAVYASNCIGNYYGIPFVYEFDEKHYLALGDVTGINFVSVSTEFYEAFVNEFKKES